MNNIRDQIVAELENYREHNQSIALMKYHLSFPKNTTDSCTEHLGKESITEKQRQLISLHYKKLSRQVDRLMAHIDLLDEPDASILRMTYFEGKTNREIADELKCSPRTVTSHRKRAIDTLCKLYQFPNTLF